MLSNPSELKDARSKIEEFCKSNLPNIELASVTLAIDEALQNVIRYSYKMKKDQKIDLNLPPPTHFRFKPFDLIVFKGVVPIISIRKSRVKEGSLNSFSVFYALTILRHRVASNQKFDLKFEFFGVDYP